jgi:hypothetical protein
MLRLRQRGHAAQRGSKWTRTGAPSAARAKLARRGVAFLWPPCDGRSGLTQRKLAVCSAGMRALSREEVRRSARSARAHDVDATRGESGRQTETRASHVTSARSDAASSNSSLSLVGSACAGSRRLTRREAEAAPSCGPHLRSQPPHPPSASSCPSPPGHARSQDRHMSRWPADRSRC